MNMLYAVLPDILTRTNSTVEDMSKAFSIGNVGGLFVPFFAIFADKYVNFLCMFRHLPAIYVHIGLVVNSMLKSKSLVILLTLSAWSILYMPFIRLCVKRLSFRRT